MVRKLAFPVVLLASAVTVSVAVAAILSRLVTFREPALETRAPERGAGVLDGVIAFRPPRADEAPRELREAVLYGERLARDTGKLLPDHVGNALACTNCHFEAGRARDGISLVGVAAVYPQYRKRTDYATDLASRVNECFERSMNGRAIPAEGKEMQALLAYLTWISRGIPVYAHVPWLGLKKLDAARAGDAGRGAATFRDKCSACHGQDGNGTPAAPPLWGERSYNDGAGMSRIPDLAAFARASMPKSAPSLSDGEAIDVATFVNTRPRPRFEKQRAPGR